MNLMNYGTESLDFQNPPEPSPPSAGLSRRGFIVTSLASGFALASNPLMAQAITTDTKGLKAGEVSVPVADGKIPAYFAMPAKPGKHPVILVVEEIFGVHEHIKDMCRRYAKLGYYAIAPELFSRQGDPTKMTDINEILTTIISKVPDSQVLSDLDATVVFAKGTGHVDVARLGIVGYCWGGRTVWEYAAHNPAIKAGVAYYGLLNGMKSDIKPQDPVDFGETIKIPVLGLYAGDDAFIKQDVITQMRGELAKGSSGSEIVVFPGVNHGFNADYRPTYDRVAATYAQELAQNWFKEHGV